MAKPIRIEIIGDAKKFNAAMGGVETSTSRFSKTMGRAAKVAAAAFAAGAVSVGISSVNLASEMEEAAGAASKIFGTGLGKLNIALEDSATSMGLSSVQAQKLTNSIGVLFKETSDAERATIALDLAARAADVGSMLDFDPEVVIGKFTAALNGSSETVRELGINTSDAAIQQYALENSIEGVGGKLSEAQKQMIRYEIIIRDSAHAAGDFEDTSGSLANQQRIMSAQWADIQTQLGTKLLPVMTKLAGFVNDVLLPAILHVGDAISAVTSTIAEWSRVIAENKPLLAAFAVVVGAIGVAILTVAVPAFIAWAAAWWAVNGAAVVTMAPIIAVGLAIAALVAGVIYAYQNFDIFRNVVDGVASFITDTVVPAFLKIVKIVTNRLIPIFAKIAGFMNRRLVPAFMKVAEFIVGTLIPAYVKIYSYLFRRLIPIFLSVVKFITGRLVPAFLRIVTFISGRLVPGFGRIVGFVKSKLIPVFTRIVGSITGRVIPAFNRMANRVTNVWNAAVAMKNGIARTFTDVVRNIITLPGRITRAASGMWDGIKNAFKAAINFIIDGWNRLSFSVPSVSVPFVGSFGGFTVGTPNIPRLATGTSSFAGGLARVGERGPETVSLPRGSRVTPNHLSRVSNGDVNVFVTTNADPFQVGTEVAWAIRTGSGI